MFVNDFRKVLFELQKCYLQFKFFVIGFITFSAIFKSGFLELDWINLHRGILALFAFIDLPAGYFSVDLHENNSKTVLRIDGIFASSFS